MVNQELIWRIEAGFGRQGIMSALGARLVTIEPGRIEIELPFSISHTQQQGFVHAGAIATIADTAGGYASLTMMEPGDDVVAIEFKINLLSLPLATGCWRAAAWSGPARISASVLRMCS